MKTIFTLHGVGILGSQGPWQKTAQKVLGPHFHCIPMKYQHYRCLGPLSAVVEPHALIPGCLVALLLFRYRWIPGPWLLAAALVFVFAVSLYLARFRHRRALDYFVKQSSEQLDPGDWPHVIAHSMGTKLVGTALVAYPHVRFSHIILAGCVLRTDYPWKELRQTDPDRFAHVRNEVGKRDLVPRLTGIAAKLRLMPHYGSAGSDGFDVTVKEVHTVGDPNLFCPKCAQGRAPIHNIILREFGHGTAVDSAAYASYYWLPFLWRIEPGEYSKFLHLCRTANELNKEEEKDWSAIRAAEEELLETNWRWTGGLTLRAYIDQIVKNWPMPINHGAPPDSSLVLRFVWEAVSRASKAYHNRSGNWEAEIRALRPDVAVIRATKAILG